MSTGCSAYVQWFARASSGWPHSALCVAVSLAYANQLTCDHILLEGTTIR